MAGKVNGWGITAALMVITALGTLFFYSQAIESKMGDYVPRTEFEMMSKQTNSRLDRIEDKIDQLLQKRGF